MAGMAEGVEGRISGSLHGSQVNVYLLLCVQFLIFFFKKKNKTSSSVFYSCIANCDAVIIL